MEGQEQIGFQRRKTRSSYHVSHVCSGERKNFIFVPSSLFSLSLRLSFNADQGELATRLSHIRAMRGAKKEVLRLLTTFIEKAGPPDAPPVQVAEAFLPPMLDPILGDYHVSRARLFALISSHSLLYMPRASVP